MEESNVWGVFEGARAEYTLTYALTQQGDDKELDVIF